MSRKHIVAAITKRKSSKCQNMSNSNMIALEMTMLKLFAGYLCKYLDLMHKRNYISTVIQQ